MQTEPEWKKTKKTPLHQQ